MSKTIVPTRLYETCFDSINFLNDKFFNSRPLHVRSKVPLYISDHEKVIKKVLTTSSFSNKTLYKVKEYKLNFWKKFILFQLNKFFPQYDIHIKSDAIFFNNDKKSPDEYNHVTFNCAKDEKSGTIWVTMRLTLQEPVPDLMELDDDDDEDDEEE